MARDTKKKTLPEHLAQECFRLADEQGWSCEQISGWLKREHGRDHSGEWVRRLLAAMRGKETKVGVAPPTIEKPPPEALDDDDQLRRVQCDAFRAAEARREVGDLAGWSCAAKIHIQATLARKRIKEAAAPGPAAEDDAVTAFALPGVEVPRAAKGN